MASSSLHGSLRWCTCVRPLLQLGSESPSLNWTITDYFQCLSRSTEDFSYFTLLRPAKGSVPATSLFGISCTRQMDSSTLLNRPADVTRSTVQKAVVVIADSPQFFGMLRERLSVVTNAWFIQKDFSDTEILKRFQESLKAESDRGKLGDADEDRDQYLGMSLRQLVREFKWQTLVLFKCCLLQPKVGFLVVWVLNLEMQCSNRVTDVIFWFEMRTTLHDAILFDIFNTGVDS